LQSSTGKTVAKAVSVLSADQAEKRAAADTLILDHEQRRTPRGTFKALRGTMVEIALPLGQRLRAGDILQLDDDSLIEIVAKPEPLLEVRAADSSALARLAWLLGDHHIPVEIHERRLRLHRSDTARALLQPLGARLIDIEGPFEPEGGAYEGHAHR
jgi:urease accessory protein